MRKFKVGDSVTVLNEDTGEREPGIISQLLFHDDLWYEVRTADDLPWAHESLIRLASDPVEPAEPVAETLGPRDQAHKDWNNHMARQGEREYEEGR